MSLDTTLPSPKDITRSELESPEFNVHDFLLDHCQYRSLSDLKQLVHKWQVRLGSELQDTVNDNYKDLTGSQTQLKQAKDDLTSVKLEVLQFKAQISKAQKLLQDKHIETSAAQQRQNQLAKDEKRVLQLINFCKNVEKLERLPAELSDLQLIELSKILVGLRRTVEHDDAPIVREGALKLQGFRDDLVKRMDARIKQTGSFEVMMARAWL